MTRHSCRNLITFQWLATLAGIQKPKSLAAGLQQACGFVEQRQRAIQCGSTQVAGIQQPK
eukprot:2896882-Rhodomonas_salina.1